MRHLLVLLAASTITAPAFAQLRTVVSGAHAPTMTTATIAHYALDGNPNDSSGNGKPASLVGGSWQPGFDGKNPGALAIDAKTQLKIPDYGGYFTATDFAVSMRVKTNLQGGNLLQIVGGRWCYLQNLIEKSNFDTHVNVYKVSYKLQLGACIPYLAAGSLMFSYTGVDGKTYDVGLPYDLQNPASVPANQWTDITISYDGTYMRILINGVEKQKLAAPPPVATDAGIALGKAYAGLMDDVRFTKTVKIAPTAVQAR